MWAPSDFDLRHQISAFFIGELPFGRGKAFLNGSNPVVNGIVGGWQFTTIYRQTSGFPGSAQNGVGYPTVWDFTGYGTLTGKLPGGKHALGNVFSNPAAAYAAYTDTYAGDSGTRNNIRGMGIFNIDAGLGKRFPLFKVHSDTQSLQIRVEGFNMTNSAPLDVEGATMTLATPATFGKYTSTLTQPREFQAALRYEF
jgi:hypothetical protein